MKPAIDHSGNKSGRADERVTSRGEGTRKGKKKSEEREWRERRDDNTLCLFALECIIPLKDGPIVVQCTMALHEIILERPRET